MRCGICFGDHDTKQHKRGKVSLAKDGDITHRCPGCMAYVDSKTLKQHKRKGCATVVQQPPAVNLRGSDDHLLQQPD